MTTETSPKREIHESYRKLTEDLKASIKSSVTSKHPKLDQNEVVEKIDKIFLKLEIGATPETPDRRRYAVHNHVQAGEILSLAVPLGLIKDIFKENPTLGDPLNIANNALWKAAFHTKNPNSSNAAFIRNEGIGRHTVSLLNKLKTGTDSRYSAISALLMLEQSLKDLVVERLVKTTEEVAKPGHSFGNPNSSLDETLSSVELTIDRLYYGVKSDFGVNDCMAAIIKTRAILGEFISTQFPELKDDDDRRMLYGVIANFTFLKRSKLSGSQLSSLDSELIDSLRSKNYKKAEDALKSFIAENPEASTFGTYREAPYLVKESTDE